MDTWNQARLATGNFNDQLGDGKLELQKANRDATAIYKSPGKYGFNSYLRGTPIVRSATMTEQEAIQKHVQFAERFGYGTRTRQKAYMNQLREFMYANKMIDTRDQIVTPDLIKQAISKLPKGMQSIKKASEQFKSMRSYTKWFNTIPLLGVGAVGANKYFTSNENRD